MTPTFAPLGSVVVVLVVVGLVVDGLAVWAKALVWKPPDTRDVTTISATAKTPPLVTTMRAAGLW
ncbi:MAG: hypothetical protein M3396_01105 [Actinomycetota bacterium]|nr:hypothetical protein [Actinomycetota bacterium]MDQ3574633.1 hypothetical protein [Actinomycetota bacterium]